MELQAEVTSKDIWEGTKQNCLECPVALAVNRALKSIKHQYPLRADVGNICIIIHADTPDYSYTAYRAILPEDVTLFIMDFDQERAVKPFKFALFLEKVFLA